MSFSDPIGADPGPTAGQTTPSAKPSILRQFPAIRLEKKWQSRRRGAVGAALGLAFLGVVNWGIFGPLSHRIDDNFDFRPPENLQGGSSAVSMAAALIDREVNQHAWTPNDPWIFPSAVIDNTPNFQQGMMRALARFNFELLDEIGRTRGSSSKDPDLERATGLLQFPADQWVLNLSTSWLPTVPSEDQYRAGLKALTSYNTRLAAGDAVFERRADAFANTLGRISDDLGAQTARIERGSQSGWWVFSTHADDVFYQNKGMLYAYAMVLGALGEDFEALIAERGAQGMWDQALGSLRQAADMQPLIVVNGKAPTSIFANHLMLQGFHMKRAILQLEELVSVLAV